MTREVRALPTVRRLRWRPSSRTSRRGSPFPDVRSRTYYNMSPGRTPWAPGIKGRARWPGRRRVGVRENPSTSCARPAAGSTSRSSATTERRRTRRRRNAPSPRARRRVKGATPTGEARRPGRRTRPTTRRPASQAKVTPPSALPAARDFGREPPSFRDATSAFLKRFTALALMGAHFGRKRTP